MKAVRILRITNPHITVVEHFYTVDCKSTETGQGLKQGVQIHGNRERPKHQESRAMFPWKFWGVTRGVTNLELFLTFSAKRNHEVKCHASMNCFSM